MPSLLSFVTLALAATSVFATSPTPVKRDILSFNPDPSVVDVNALLKRDVHDTNARRFAAGLHPANPRRSHRKMARDPAPSGTPAGTKTGYLKVTDSDGQEYGYLSPGLNTFGEYGLFTADKASALLISFDSSSNTNRDILASNSVVTSLPYLGASVGYSSDSDSLSIGSPNYLFLTANTQSSPNQPAIAGGNSFSIATGIVKSAASPIWTYDSATNIFTPQWVNPDSSLPATSAVYVPSEQAIALIGDLGLFNLAFGIVVKTLVFTFELA